MEAAGYANAPVARPDIAVAATRKNDGSKPSAPPLAIGKALPGALFRIGFLTEAVIEAQAEHAWLICRLAQIEVAGVAVDNRVLVSDVGDIELGEPVGPFRVQPEAQVHDGVARLQDARKTVGPRDVQVIPHVALVGDVKLRVAPQVFAQRVLVAQVRAPAEVRHVRQPFADDGYNCR